MRTRSRLRRLEVDSGRCSGRVVIIGYTEGEPVPEVPVCRRCRKTHAIVICESVVSSGEGAAGNVEQSRA